MLIPYLLLAFNILFLKVLVASSSIQGQGQNSLVLTSKFDLLSSDLIIYIGRYLVLPQKNLGFVNKETFKALFKIYPLNFLINERLNIPELLNSVNMSDLIFFEKLMSVTDPIHLFYAIATGTFVQNAFPHNGKLLTCYISRILPTLIEKYDNDLDAELTSTTNIAFSLLSYGDFDSLFDLFNKLPRPFNHFFIHLDVFMDNEFIERLMGYKNGIEIYSKLLQILNSIPNQAKFIACSILVNSVPEELYLHKLVSSKNLMKETFNIIFFEPSQIVQHRYILMFETISRCLNHIKLNVSTEDQDEVVKLNGIIDHLNLVNFIRFGPVDQNILLEIESKSDIPFEKLKELAKAALLSGKQGLFQQIIKNQISAFFKSDFGNETAQNIFILNALSSLSREDQQNIHNNFDFFILISSYYEPRIVTQSSHISIDFELKNEYNYLPLPKLFLYFYTVDSESIRIDEIFESLFKQLNYINHDELIKLISSVSICPIFNQLFVDSSQFPIFTTFEVLYLISQYQDLLELVTSVGIHFTTDEDNFAKLLENPINHMNFIIKYVEFDSVMPLLITKSQLRNLEDFLGKSIDEIFFQNILLTLNDEINMKSFFELRIALNYWLEGPRRDQLLHLNIPLFRRLLAKESSDEDAIFLINDLIDE
jgi:hypothetical protein